MLQRYKIFLNGCNITTFLAKFTHYLTKKHIKYNLLSERNRDKNTIRR